MSKPKVCVTGAAGFIGNHLCRYLKERGYWVRATDCVKPRYGDVPCDECWWNKDLRYYRNAEWVTGGVDWVFALAADMGGAGYVFTGEHDREILMNNILINVNTLKAARLAGVERYLFASSACVYPEYRQVDEWCKPLQESDAYPAQPDSAYGWEKLFTEQLCLAHRSDKFKVKIARFHNVYGPRGAWNDGREKAPAAMCRKVAMAKLTGDPTVEVWGDGSQIRSYMYIGDCCEGLERLMLSDFDGPVNLGSDQTATVDGLAYIISRIAGMDIDINHVPGPTGVAWRNSDNSLCREALGWEPSTPLEDGLVPTYAWIFCQARKALDDT